MRLPELATLLNFSHPHVLSLYEQNHPQSILSAEQAWREVLKYLWLTKKHSVDSATKPADDKLPIRCVMMRSMQEIDDMWHEFILFTQDYMDFCQHYFGEYIHHLPNLPVTMPMSQEQTEQEVDKLLSYVYDNLGEETARIWFASYLQAAE